MELQTCYPALCCDVTFLDEVDLHGVAPLNVHESGVKVKSICAHPNPDGLRPWYVLATQATNGVIRVIDHSNHRCIMSLTLHQIYNYRIKRPSQSDTIADNGPAPSDTPTRVKERRDLRVDTNAAIEQTPHTSHRLEQVYNSTSLTSPAMSSLHRERFLVHTPPPQLRPPQPDGGEGPTETDQSATSRAQEQARLVAAISADAMATSAATGGYAVMDCTPHPQMHQQQQLRQRGDQWARLAGDAQVAADSNALPVLGGVELNATTAAQLGEVRRACFCGPSRLAVLTENCLLIFDWQTLETWVIDNAYLVTQIRSAAPVSLELPQLQDPKTRSTIRATAVECVHLGAPLLAVGTNAGLICLVDVREHIRGILPGGLLCTQQGVHGSGGSAAEIFDLQKISLPTMLSDVPSVCFFSADSSGNLLLWTGVLTSRNGKYQSQQQQDGHSAATQPSAVLCESSGKSPEPDVYTDLEGASPCRETLLSQGTPATPGSQGALKRSGSLFGPFIQYGHSNNHYNGESVSYDPQTNRLVTVHFDHSVRLWDLDPLIESTSALVNGLLKAEDFVQLNLDTSDQWVYRGFSGTQLKASNSAVSLNKMQNETIEPSPHLRQKYRKDGTLAIPLVRRYKPHEKLIRDKNKNFLSLAVLHQSSTYPAASETSLTAVCVSKGGILTMVQGLHAPPNRVSKETAADVADLNDGRAQPRLRTVHEVDVADLLTEHLKRKSCVEVEAKEEIMTKEVTSVVQDILLGKSGSTLKIYGVTPLRAHTAESLLLLATNIGQCVLLLHSDRYTSLSTGTTVASHPAWRVGEGEECRRFLVSFPDKVLVDTNLVGRSSGPGAARHALGLLNLVVQSVESSVADTEKTLRGATTTVGSDTLSALRDIEKSATRRNYHLGDKAAAYKTTALDLMVKSVNSSNGNNANSAVSSRVLTLTKPVLIPSLDGRFLAIFWPHMCRYVVLRVVSPKVDDSRGSNRADCGSLSFEDCDSGHCSSFAWVSHSFIDKNTGYREQVFSLVSPAKYTTSTPSSSPGDPSSSSRFGSLFGGSGGTASVASTAAIAPPQLQFKVISSSVGSDTDVKACNVRSLDVSHTIPPGWHVLSSGPLLFIAKCNTHSFESTANVQKRETQRAIAVRNPNDVAMLASSMKLPGLYISGRDQVGADFRSARTGCFYALQKVPESPSSGSGQGSKYFLKEVGPAMRVLGATTVTWCPQSLHVGIISNGKASVLRLRVTTVASSDKADNGSNTGITTSLLQLSTVGTVNISRSPLPSGPYLRGATGLRVPVEYAVSGWWHLGVLHLKLCDGSIRLLCTGWSRGTALMECIEAITSNSSIASTASISNSFVAFSPKNSTQALCTIEESPPSSLLDVVNVETVRTARGIVQGGYGEHILGVYSGSLYSAHGYPVLKSYFNSTAENTLAVPLVHNVKLHQSNPLSEIVLLLAAGASGPKFIQYIRNFFQRGTSGRRKRTILDESNIPNLSDSMELLRGLNERKINDLLSLHKRLVLIACGNSSGDLSAKKAEDFSAKIDLQCQVANLCISRNLHHIAVNLPLFMHAAKEKSHGALRVHSAYAPSSLTSNHVRAAEMAAVASITDSACRVRYGGGGGDCSASASTPTTSITVALDPKQMKMLHGRGDQPVPPMQ